MFDGLRRAMADMRTMNTLLPAAERIARSEGVDAPAAEHLVLASLDLPDGSARRALQDAGADADRLRGALAAQHDAALRAVGVSVDHAALDAALPGVPAEPHGVYASQPSAQALFQRVRLLANADHAPLYSAYVLLAAAELEHGTIPRALALLGITRDALATTARRELDSLPQRA
jgi:ATP-dependent Clp protease ATP-binding subunit ClpA